MDFGRSFTFVTEDANWLKKVGIAALVSLIPIVGGIIVLGWALEITRRVINNESETLPDWSDFSGFLTKGFQAAVISLAYALPLILISSCTQGLTAFATSSQSGDSAQILTSILAITGLCVGCFTLLYSIALGLILPAAMANFVVSGQLGAGFRFNEVIGLVRSAPGPYLMALLGTMLAGFLVPFGLIACFVGVFFTGAYYYAVMGHLYGQAYNAARSANAGM